MVSKMNKQDRAEVVTKRNHGILPQFEVFYLSSILYPTKLCLQAFSWYENNKEKIDANLLIGAIQNAMGHAAAISRFFWPSRTGKATPITNLREARGLKLRQAFGITKHSPLNNRNLRNTFEHFDEKLDVFLLENNAGLFLPDCLTGSYKNISVPTTKIFKLIDKEENCIILLGKKFEFLSIKEEIRIINKKTMEMIEHSGRLPK